MSSSAAVLSVLLLVSAANAFLFDSGSDVKFTLYRRNVKESKIGMSKLSGLNSFDPKAKSYFIIHGWNGGTKDGWVADMKNALLKKEDANVFFVDWSKWARTLNYLKAKAKCDEAGSALATFIKRLEKEKKASRTRMHLIGHSLGGQVAGFAGAKMQSPKVARITGLDTSGIAFNCLFSRKDCLDSTDATFVDEIHSLVSALPKGHADFFPVPANRAKTEGLVQAHRLAIEYFIKSIGAGSCAFKSTKCNSQLSFMDGKCSGNQVNSVGFYAKKPSSKPPNNYYMTIDINKPC